MNAKTEASKVRIIKKKARGHGGHHGGAWKVAYADFVTAMMALFMVLWLVSQTDQTTKSSLSAYFRTGVFSGAPFLAAGGAGIQNGGPTDRSIAAPYPSAAQQMAGAAREVRQLAKTVSEQTGGDESLDDHLDVRITDGGLLIQLAEGSADDLLFDVSSSRMKPALVHFLERLAPVLAKIDTRLQIHGHTDSLRFAPDSIRDNWLLSFERADQARKLLISSGVPESQFAGVFAHGDAAPLVPTDTTNAKNRRLAILAVRPGAPGIAAPTIPPEPGNPNEH